MTDNAEKTAAARLDVLETRVAHQDRTIEDLNEAVVAQWQEIDRLKRRLGQLEDRLQKAEGGLAEIEPPEPPPPHY